MCPDFDFSYTLTLTRAYIYIYYPSLTTTYYHRPLTRIVIRALYINLCFFKYNTGQPNVCSNSHNFSNILRTTAPWLKILDAKSTLTDIFFVGCHAPVICHM